MAHKTVFSIKDGYLNSRFVSWNRMPLSEILNGMILTQDYVSKQFDAQAGEYYEGILEINVPDGYEVISIIPSDTTASNKNFFMFNLINGKTLYYQLYCRYSTATATRFRVYLIRSYLTSR